MSLTANLLRGLGSLVTKSRRRDAIIDLMPSWFGSQSVAVSTGKNEFVNHFRGWDYVAIKAICEAVAGMSPCVAKREDGNEVASSYRKSLSAAKSFRERDAIRDQYRRKYLSSQAKTKALAHLQDSDELTPVSNTHPLMRLLRNPNGPDVAWSFWYKVMLYLELTGASYIWTPPGKADDKPKQLWVIPSHWVYEQPGDDELIGSYEIRPSFGQIDATGFGAGWFPGAGGRERRPASEIIKIAYPNPHSIIDGYAPTWATSSWTDVSNNIDRSRVQVFANAAFPGVGIELDIGTENPDPSTIERIQATFAEKYSGVRNTGRPAILAPGMKIIPLSRTNVEMDYTNSAEQARAHVLAGRGVPQSIAGLVEQSTFTNATAARFNFFGSTISPKLMLIGQIMTEKLARRWDENLIVYWPDPTPNDPEMQLKKAETLARLKANTPNEIRESFGLTPWEYGGDDPIGGLGEQPLGWATGEQPMDNMAESLMGGMGMDGGDEQQGQQPQQGGQQEPGGDVVGELLKEIGGQS